MSCKKGIPDIWLGAPEFNALPGNGIHKVHAGKLELLHLPVGSPFCCVMGGADGRPVHRVYHVWKRASHTQGARAPENRRRGIVFSLERRHTDRRELESKMDDSTFLMPGPAGLALGDNAWPGPRNPSCLSDIDLK